MYSRQRLEQDINELLLAGEVSARWITMKICGRYHVGAFDPTESHATLCQFAHTRDVAGKLLANFVRDLDHPQIEIGGEMFTNLQPQYVVTRDDDEVGVSIYELTDDEIDAISERLIKEGRKKIKHGRELQAFKLARRKIIAA